MQALPVTSEQTVKLLQAFLKDIDNKRNCFNLHSFKKKKSLFPSLPALTGHFLSNLQLKVSAFSCASFPSGIAELIQLFPLKIFQWVQSGLSFPQSSCSSSARRQCGHLKMACQVWNSLFCQESSSALRWLVNNILLSRDRKLICRDSLQCFFSSEL